MSYSTPVLLEFAPLSSTIPWSLLKFMSIESVIVSRVPFWVVQKHMNCVPIQDPINSGAKIRGSIQGTSIKEEITMFKKGA